MLITENMMVAANFGMQHRDWCVILYKIYHFHQPFLKVEFSNKVSCGPPFAKIPSMIKKSAAALRAQLSFWN